MFYNGAAEWFFYLGLEAGLNAQIDDMDLGLDGILFMDTMVAKSCHESYRWGFSLGLALTSKEYEHLTSWPELDTIIPEVVQYTGIVTSPLEVNESNFPIVGNC